MKYKAGDMVRVLYTRNTIEKMVEMVGGVFEIKEVGEGYYKVYNKDKSDYWNFREDCLELAETKPKNLIPLIAKELGVEIGEEFECCHSKYKFLNDGLYEFIDKTKQWHITSTLNHLLSGKVTIKKLPQKPTLTETERVILGALDKKWKWIARDEDGELDVFDEKPLKDERRWDYMNNFLAFLAFEHLFRFIKWEDSEPYNIAELLGVEDVKN